MSELILVPLEGRRFYEIDFLNSSKIDQKLSDNLKESTNEHSEYKTFPEVSFFLGLSNTESDINNCIKSTDKTGKAGRPKTVISGKKVPYHIHIISTGKNVTKANELLQQAINKNIPLK